MGDDYLSTTAVVTYVRKRVTPTVLWSAVGALVTALAVSITWLVNTQADIRRLKDSVAEMQQDRDVLHRIDTALAVMNTKVDGMNAKVDGVAAEVDRQRDWREHLEREAETPPHARRQHR